MTFYVYLWLRADGTPYYVGKGHHGKSHERRAFRKGCPPHDRIILQEYDSEADAFVAEQLLIAYYGRKDNNTGILRNLTNGGEGTSGTVYSEKDKKRRGRLGRIPWNVGKVGCFHLSSEAKAKISEANKRRIWSETSKQRNSQSKIGHTPWMKGRHHSSESNERNRVAHLGKPAWNKETDDQCLKRLFQATTHLMRSCAA